MRFIHGLAASKASLRKQGKNLESFIKTQVEIVGRKGELEAKQKAPKDLGGLGQSIAYESTKNGYGARLSANVFYAPYQEFGTGGKVNIPKGFEDMAKKFQTGNGKISMKAQPYLIPSAKNAYQDLVRRLRKRFRE